MYCTVLNLLLRRLMHAYHTSVETTRATGASLPGSTELATLPEGLWSLTCHTLKRDGCACSIASNSEQQPTPKRVINPLRRLIVL